MNNGKATPDRLIAIRLLCVAVASTTLPMAASATPPCMPPVCAPSGTFDRQVCDARADWVAVGRIAQVAHHPMGDPFNVDEFEFDFIPERVERAPKEGPPPTAAVHYGVGWCDNPAPRLAGPDQRYRVYGVARRPGVAADIPNEYLWIETVP